MNKSSDIRGHVNVPSPHGLRYCLFVIDHHTNFMWTRKTPGTSVPELGAGLSICEGGVNKRRREGSLLSDYSFNSPSETGVARELNKAGLSPLSNLASLHHGSAAGTDRALWRREGPTTVCIYHFDEWLLKSILYLYCYHTPPQNSEQYFAPSREKV
jgi:hypothetical protein